MKLLLTLIFTLLIIIGTIITTTGCAPSVGQLYTAARNCDKSSPLIPDVDKDGVVNVKNGQVVMKKDKTACKDKWPQGAY